jgi:hypothetical protein
MPELVTCPACGCGMQVPEFRLGQSTRCIACARVFQAGQAGAAPEPGTYPVHGPLDGPPSPEPQRPGRGLTRQRMPLCPGCHRPVPWEALACPHCRHELDPLDVVRQGAPQGRRRDGEEHRGGTIDILGTISLLFGALALCTGPVGGLVALATGIPAWVMADRDLEAMRTGAIDPAGRDATLSGRSRAIIGTLLGAVCGALGVIVLVALNL